MCLRRSHSGTRMQSTYSTSMYVSDFDVKIVKKRMNLVIISHLDICFEKRVRGTNEMYAVARKTLIIAKCEWLAMSEANLQCQIIFTLTSCNIGRILTYIKFVKYTRK
jgi:hypothetical protein